MQTLRRELRLKFSTILQDHLMPDISEELADAALEVAGIQKRDVPQVIEQANAKVDAILAQAKNEKWPFREKFPEPYRDLLDAFVDQTGIKPIKAQVNDWMASASDWLEIGAKPADVRQACEEAKPNERGFGGFKINRPGSITTTLQRVVGERNKGSGGSDLLSFIRNYKEKNG